MKIVCEACSAKYSISDDKVRGKVFKIRCKKCSHVIVVRGDANDAPAAESSVSEVSAPVAAPAADGQWYVVIDGEQVGPLTAADVADRVASGQVTGENFAWMEGMADWSQIASIPDLAGALNKRRSVVPSAPPADDFDSPFAPQPTAIMPPGQVEDMFRAADSVAASAKAAPAAAKAASVASATRAPAAKAASAGHDLFAPQAAAEPEDQFSAAPTAVAGSGMGLGGFGMGAPLGGGGGMFGNVAAEAPAASAGGAAMTGQRSENSVLFSLSNLEALAAPKSMAVPSFGGGGPASAGAPPADGSGLIDIRAMASMTLGKPRSAPNFSNFGDLGGGSSGGLGDLPSFSSAPMSPVNAPLLPGSSGNSGGMPKWVIAVVGVGVLVIGALAFTIIKLLNNAPPALAPVAEAPVRESPTTAPAETPAPRAAAPDPTPPPVAVAEAPPPAEARPADEPKAAKPSGGSKHGSSSSKKPAASKAVAAAAPAAREPERAPEPAAKPSPAPKKGNDSLDDLLSGALGGSKPSAPSGGSREPAAAAPAGKKAGPLSKSDIVKVMSGVMPKAKACYDQYKVPGMANVNVKVEGSGKVSMATVSGKFAGTPSGICVERAIKSAKFPASDDGMTFPYPVPLR